MAAFSKAQNNGLVLKMSTVFEIIHICQRVVIFSKVVCLHHRALLKLRSYSNFSQKFLEIPLKSLYGNCISSKFYIVQYPWKKNGFAFCHCNQTATELPIVGKGFCSSDFLFHKII